MPDMFASSFTYGCDNLSQIIVRIAFPPPNSFVISLVFVSGGLPVCSINEDLID